MSTKPLTCGRYFQVLLPVPDAAWETNLPSELTFGKPFPRWLFWSRECLQEQSQVRLSYFKQNWIFTRWTFLHLENLAIIPMNPLTPIIKKHVLQTYVQATPTGTFPQLRFLFFFLDNSSLCQAHMKTRQHTDKSNLKEEGYIIIYGLAWWRRHDCRGMKELIPFYL